MLSCLKVKGREKFEWEYDFCSGNDWFVILLVSFMVM